MIHVPAHRPDDIHSLDDLAEDDMPAVQPGGLLHGDEELRPVSVLSGVSHRQPARAVVLQLEVLIGEPEILAVMRGVEYDDFKDD